MAEAIVGTFTLVALCLMFVTATMKKAGYSGQFEIDRLKRRGKKIEATIAGTKTVPRTLDELADTPGFTVVRVSPEHIEAARQMLKKALADQGDNDLEPPDNPGNKEWVLDAK